MACTGLTDENAPPTSISGAVGNHAYSYLHDVMTYEISESLTSMTSSERSDYIFHYSGSSDDMTSQLLLPLPSYDSNYMTCQPLDSVPSQPLTSQDSAISKVLKRRRHDSDVALPSDLVEVVPFSTEEGVAETKQNDENFAGQLGDFPGAVPLSTEKGIVETKPTNEYFTDFPGDVPFIPKNRERLEERLNTLLETNFAAYSPWFRETTTKHILEYVMEYSNPPSVSSTCEAGNKKNPKTVLKLEKSKKGQIDVKAGHRIWESMPLDLQEDVASYLDREPENVDTTGKGERIFTEVKQFFDQKTDPKVKDLRANIPKAVLLLFHTPLVAEGREKIRDMWVKSAKPEQWLATVPFVDPNNGNKLQKSDLEKVYKFLKAYFKKNEGDIRKALCLDVGQARERCQWQQKVMSSVKRAEREVANVLKKMTLSTEIKGTLTDLKAFLEDINVEDEESVLRAFDAASAVQRLMLEIEMAKKPVQEIVSTCKRIRDTFEAGVANRTMQPASSDVGQRYVHSMEETTPQLFHISDPTILGINVNELEKMELVDKVLDLGFLPVDPCSTVQTVNSDPLDTTHSPQILLEQGQSNQSFQPIEYESDILGSLCESLQLDETDVYDVPQKKMKTEDVNEMKTSLNSITVSEVGSLEPAAETSNIQLLTEASESQILKDILDQLASGNQVESTLIIGNDMFNSEGGLLEKQRELESLHQPSAPATQMTGVVLPTPMIPVCVEAVDMEVE